MVGGGAKYSGYASPSQSLLKYVEAAVRPKLQRKVLLPATQAIFYYAAETCIMHRIIKQAKVKFFLLQKLYTSSETPSSL